MNSWFLLLLIWSCCGNNGMFCFEPCRHNHHCEHNHCDCNNICNCNNNCNDNLIQPRSYLNYSSVDTFDCDDKTEKD